jgi:hypothetical protein
MQSVESQPIFRKNISLPSSKSKNKPRNQREAFINQSSISLRFLVWLILRSWRWERYVPPKRRLDFQHTTWHYIQEDRTSVNKVSVVFLILNKLFNEHSYSTYIYLKGYTVSTNYTVKVSRRYGNEPQTFLIVPVDRDVWLTWHGCFYPYPREGSSDTRQTGRSNLSTAQHRSLNTINRDNTGH